MKTKIKLNQMKTDELLEEIQKNNLKVLEIEKITEEECDCGVPHSYLRFEGELDEDFASKKQQRYNLNVNSNPGQRNQTIGS